MTSLGELHAALLSDMASCGIIPTDPGKIRFDASEVIRFHCAGDKKGALNGYVLVHSDGRPAGYFGSWKIRQEPFIWVHNGDHIEPEEMARLQADIQRLQRQRGEERAFTHAEVSEAATERFNGLPDASTEHPYCRRKQITPYGAHQDGNLLVLAVQDFDGQIWSLQEIRPDGTKKLMKGGKKQGNHVAIGGNANGPLMICEGYATGCSLRQMEPESEVIAAVDAYNLRTVAQAARERFPERRIIIAGDHDQVGIQCARSAAKAVNGQILIPPGIGDDWNDYAIAQGVTK